MSDDQFAWAKPLRIKPSKAAEARARAEREQLRAEQEQPARPDPPPPPGHTVKKYNAEPTPWAFHQDRSAVRILTGPVGSGKTAACIMDLFMMSLNQEPYRGVRQTRWGVIRNTYPELKATTIKSFQQWIPDHVAPIVYDVPIRCRLKQRLPDGTTLDIEWVFLALETEEDVKKLLSFELTGFWVNEIRELPKAVLDYMRGRIPRYPQVVVDEGFKGATYSCIIGDTNKWKIGHWLDEMFNGVEGPPDGFKLFEQPPAVYYDQKKQAWELNPDAENLRNLSGDYYKNQLAGNSEAYIRNMLACERGMILQGKPIFPQFSHHAHVAKDIIKPDRSLPLILGWDWGLNPACIFAQLSRRGKLCIIDELAPADEDLESFCADYVIPLLNEKYSGYHIQSIGDPAGRGRSGLDKRTVADVLNEFGLRYRPAMTNSFTPRKEAVDALLNRNEALSVSPHCVYTVQGFSGGYVYQKMQNTIAGDIRYKEKPEKNQYSHGMDAIQYICLYVRKGSGNQNVRMLGSLPSAESAPKKRFLWA